MSKSLVKNKNDEADYINRTLIIDKVKVQLIYSESLCDINRLNNIEFVSWLSIRIFNN